MSNSTPEELLKAADKRASSSGGWFSSGSGKLEEAAELFKAAGNKFRLANRFDEAGQAFMRAAETEIKAGETDYAANTFFEAHKCFKMARPERECCISTLHLITLLNVTLQIHLQSLLSL